MPALWLASHLVREVVLERELEAIIVGDPAIRVVFAPAPLELAADHDVRHREVPKVAERILAVLEIARRLAARRRDIGLRVAAAARPLLAPRAVVERNEAEDGERLADRKSTRLNSSHGYI